MTPWFVCCAVLHHASAYEASAPIVIDIGRPAPQSIAKTSISLSALLVTDAAAFKQSFKERQQQKEHQHQHQQQKQRQQQPQQPQQPQHLPAPMTTSMVLADGTVQTLTFGLSQSPASAAATFCNKFFIDEGDCGRIAVHIAKLQHQFQHQQTGLLRQYFTNTGTNKGTTVLEETKLKSTPLLQHITPLLQRQPQQPQQQQQKQQPRSGLKHRLAVLINIHVADHLHEQLHSLVKHAVPRFNVSVIYSLPNDSLRATIADCMLKFSSLHIEVNPVMIPKRTYHGSLVQGIFSNLLRTRDPDLVLVLSARTVVVRDISYADVTAALRQAALLRPRPQFWHVTNKKNSYDTQDKLLASGVKKGRFVYVDTWNFIWRTFNEYSFLPLDGADGVTLMGGAHEGIMFDGLTARGMKAYIQHVEKVDPSLMRRVYDAPFQIEECAPYTLALRVGGMAINTLAKGTHDGMLTILPDPSLTSLRLTQKI
jgi:hypothetical protein